MKLRFIKSDGGLRPFDEECNEAIKKWKPDDFIVIDATRPRNGKFMRKFFALLNIIVQNYDGQITVEDVLLHVKSELNFWEAILVGNSHHKRYRSISFAKMDEDMFSQFYDRAVNVCLKLVPMDREDLAIQIARF